MYPDLSYLLHALIGTEPDNWLSIFKTFGFFLALAFLASALVFSIELRRKAREGYYQPQVVRVTEGAPPSWGDGVSRWAWRQLRCPALARAAVGAAHGGAGAAAPPTAAELESACRGR